MSGLVFFDDDTNNDVLDEWMNNDSGTLAKGAVLNTELAAASTKGGLGYTESAQPSKQNKSGPDGKQSKQQLLGKKKQQNVAKLDHDDDELHGVVADLAEESRTSVVSKKEKELQNQKRKAELAQQPGKKQKLQANGEQGNKPNTGTGNTHNSNARKSNTQGKNGSVNTPSPNAPLRSKNVAQQSSNGGAGGPTGGAGGDAAGESVEKRENSRIRKRTKTRSKQKNIRKDNRSDTVKPSYLVVKDQEYRGRPLTEQTKARLGVVG